MKDELYKSVQEKLASLEVTDYNSVVDAFRRRFAFLTDDIKKLSNSIVVNSAFEKERKEIFSILEFELVLEGSRKSVKLQKGDKHNISDIGVVNFKEGYSFIQFDNDPNDYYFSPKTVDKVFKEAFYPLLKETL